MKSILALSLITLFFAACQRNEVSPSGPGTPLNLSSSRFGAESSEFAFEWFRNVLVQEGGSANVVASPLSLHIALGMALNGADGQTAEELLAALRLKGYSPEQYNQIYRELTQGLPAVDPKVSLAIANSLWYRDGLAVEAPYVESLKSTFAAEVKPLTNDAGPVNAWVKNKTRGKIEKMYDRISPDIVLLLLNAVYFKGDWTKQFDEKQTSERTWVYEDGRKKLHRVQMMSQEQRFRNAFTENYAAVELPYGNGDYRMTLLLPSEGTQTTEFAKTFDAAAWTTLQQRLAEGKIRVNLPRFEFAYELKPNLNQTLQAMGIKTAFTSGADFSKIRGRRDLFISEVKQKAYIKTDEKGSEAAAVTGIGFELTSVGPQVPVIDLNRAFLFFISEKNSNTVLFSGRVAEP